MRFINFIYAQCIEFITGRCSRRMQLRLLAYSKRSLRYKKNQGIISDALYAISLQCNALRTAPL